MVWPFRRRTVAEEPAAEQPEQPPTRAWREWATVPALRPVGITATGLTVSDAGGFPSTLATSWQQAPILQPLSHELSLSAPAGLTSGIVAPVEGYGNEPELTWRDTVEDAPALPQLAVVQPQPVTVREVVAPEQPEPPRRVPVAADPEPAGQPAGVRAPAQPETPEEPDPFSGYRPAANPVTPTLAAEALPGPETEQELAPAPRTRRVGRIGPPLNVDPVPPSVLASPAEDPPSAPGQPAPAADAEPERPSTVYPLIDPYDDFAPAEVPGPEADQPVARPPGPYAPAAPQEEPRTTATAAPRVPGSAQRARPRPIAPTVESVRNQQQQPAPDAGTPEAPQPSAAAGAPDLTGAPAPAAAPGPQAAARQAAQPQDLPPPDPDEYGSSWTGGPTGPAPAPPVLRPLVSAQPLVAPEVAEPIAVLPGLLPAAPRPAADGAPPIEDERAAADPASPELGSARPALPGGPPAQPGWRPPSFPAAQGAGFPGRPAAQPAVPPLEDEYFPPPPGQDAAPAVEMPPWLAEALANASPDSPLRMAAGATPPPAATYPGQPNPKDLPPPDPDEYGGSWTGGPTGPDTPARPRQRRLGRIGAPVQGEDADPEPAAAPVQHSAPPPIAPGPAPHPLAPTPTAGPAGKVAAVDDDGDPIESDVMNGLDEETDAASKEHDDARHLDQLAGKLYGRMRDQLRRELLVDRERSLTLTDWRG